MKTLLINNNSSSRAGIEPTTVALQSHPRAPAPQRPQTNEALY